MQTDLAVTVAWWGFALAFVFGAVGNRTDFCAMGAVSDAVNVGSFLRMRMWLLAIATAVLGANALDVLGFIDLGKSIYPSPRFIWLSNIVGGLLFGAGMTLASGCPNKTLIRIGGGSLKSIVVFVFIGISAYMTLRGLFSALRVAYLEPAATTLQTQQDLPSMIAAATGVDRDLLQPAIAAAFAGAILFYVFKDREFRRDSSHIAGGLIVGLLVAAGWYVTAHLGYVAEHPDTLEEAFAGTDSGRAESFSFVAPLAYSLQLLMLWTDRSTFVSFGIASVLGVVAGSLSYALASRKSGGKVSPAPPIRAIILSARS